MNLKEAFRFQNRLQWLMDEAEKILSKDENVTRVENTHLRKKVMPEAQNETIVNAAPSEYAEQITELTGFLLYLLAQREDLSKAIRAAKNTLPIDMDSETSLNSGRQRVATLLKHMTSLRNSEVTLANGGSGYRFNADGNQVTYRCDVKRVTTINFDRKVVRKYAAELNQKADQVSAELDRCLVNSEVEYQPPFDVNDSFAEVFDLYLTSGQSKSHRGRTGLW